MYDTKKKIHAILVGSNELLEMLPNNHPFSDKSGTVARSNSIVPFDRAHLELNTPFITIQEGPTTPTGELLLTETNFYIRVYNSADKGYEGIRTITKQIDKLLRDVQLTLADGVNIVVKYDGSLAEAVDEELKQNFKEIRYRALNL